MRLTSGLRVHGGARRKRRLELAGRGRKNATVRLTSGLRVHGGARAKDVGKNCTKTHNRTQHTEASAHNN